MITQHGLKLCLLYFAVFSAAFTFIVPAFEAPDEAGHVSYINFLQKHQSLPNQLTDSLKEPLQGHQPPLYYLALYSINYVFDSDKPIEYKLTPNPLHVWNNGTNQHVPCYMHSDATGNPQNFFYVFRVISILFGMLNLFFIYKIALLVLKDEKLALLPVIFTATLPQFAFISGMINNDNPVNLFSTISIFYLLKIFNESENIKNYILAGLALGLGIISKKTIYFIIPVLIIEFIIILMSKQTMNRKKVIFGAVFLFIAALLLASEYLFHNLSAYHELVGLREEFSTFGKLDSHGIFSYYFIDPFSHEFFKSFIGYPGLMNVLLPKFLYIFYASLFIAGILFLLIRVRKIIAQHRGAIILILSIISCMAGIIYFNTLLSQFQGRFLFPVISAVSVLLVIGLREFTCMFKSSRLQPYLGFGLIIAFVIADIISIIVTYNFYFTPSQYGL